MQEDCRGWRKYIRTFLAFSDELGAGHNYEGRKLDHILLSHYYALMVIIVEFLSGWLVPTSLFTCWSYSVPMAQNPLRAQVLTTEEQREIGDRPVSGSFAMYPPGHEEFSRLQELLAQALKREAEAHRKMKHLHEQLLDVKSPRTRSCSDGESYNSQLNMTMVS